MEGKIALEEHFSTELNSRYWSAKGEERRLLDPEIYIKKMVRTGIEVCVTSPTSPGGRRFDDVRWDNATKLRIGRENAARLFALGFPTLPEHTAAGFAA